MATEPVAKNFALWLLSILEDCAIQNARMKAFILRLPEAQEPGFSLNRLLAETGQGADIARDLRQRYDRVRETLLQFPDRLEEAKASLQKESGTNRPH